MPWVLVAGLTGCGSEPPRPVSPPRTTGNAPTADDRAAPAPAPSEAPGDVAASSPTGAVEERLALARQQRPLPYGRTLSDARGDLLMNHVPERFEQTHILPGAEHFVHVYSDRTNAERGVVVEWDGSAPLLVEILDSQGKPVGFDDLPRSSRRITKTRVELLSKELGRYFFVHIKNDGNKVVTYDATIHMSIAHDP
jgi:hypothetical protein